MNQSFALALALSLSVFAAAGSASAKQEVSSSPGPQEPPSQVAWSSPPPALPAPIVGLSPAAIAAWLAAEGATGIELQTAGERRFLRVTTDGLPWLLFLQSCESDVCSDLQFSAGIGDALITPEKVNGWNRDRRFVKAIYEAGEAGQPASAIAQFDLLVSPGGTEQLADPLAIWRNLLPEFVRIVTTGAAATPPRAQ